MLKKFIALSGLLIGLYGCTSPDPSYDAGLKPTEGYEDVWYLPYNEPPGPWASDPQYNYYDNYDATEDRFLWEEQALFE